MGNKAQSQQGSQVYYDPELGQYYTQASQSQSNFGGRPNGGQLNAMGLFSSLLGSGERTYLNAFNNSPSLKEATPYQYADISLESLFPLMSQGGDSSALSGLLSGSQSTTGSASSGAGRFM